MVWSSRPSLASNVLACTFLVGGVVAVNGHADPPPPTSALSSCQRAGIGALLDYYETFRIAGHNVPPPQIGNRPTILVDHLQRRKVGDWFMISIEIPADQIDPVFGVLAKAKGNDLILGGIDVANVSFGLPKTVRAVGSEVNDLAELAAPKGPDWIERFFKEFEVEVPPFRERSRHMNARMQVNLEAGPSLDGIVNAGIVEQPFSYKFPAHPVAFRGSAVIQIPPDGNPARMLFRTAADYKRYLTRTLHVAEAEYMNPRRFLRLADSGSIEYVLGYNLRVATIGYKLGWRFDPESLQFLKALKNHLKPEDLEKVKNKVGLLIREQGLGSGVGDMDQVIREIDASP